MTHYRQCLLEKRLPNGTLSQVSWLPEPYCRVGRVLKLRNEAGVWSNGWRVLSASPDRFPEETVSHFSRDYTRTSKQPELP